MSEVLERFGITHEQAWALRAERREADTAVSSYVNLPMDTWRKALIYRRLTSAENRLAPDGDYAAGSAQLDDELLIVSGLNEVLLTAEHATDQQRNGARKEADFGTGALAKVVAYDTGATAIVTKGRQTGDANYNPGHPVKEAMAEVIEDSANKAHLALHLLYRGRASDPRDERGYSVMLGIGNKPSDATMELKDRFLEAGKALGLRMDVNKPHLNFKDHELILNEDGSLRTVTFAAAGPNTTRTFSQNLAEQLGKKVFAAIQLEINEVLLVGQPEMDYPTQFDRELGAFIGYHFTRMATEAAAKL